MRVLLVHNYYRSSAPSGENIVFEEERDLLRANGYEVNEYIQKSDNINFERFTTKLIAGISYIFNLRAFFSFRKKVKSINPDIIHIHNVFPLISLSILFAIPKNVKTIMTLHNYRLFCASGSTYRNQDTCIKCIRYKSPIFGLIHSCYKDSFIQTLPITISIFLHKILGTLEKINGFIAFTEYQREILIKAGISKDRIFIKPNFFHSQSLKIIPHHQSNEKYFIFVGRLSHEKGLICLLEAWKIMGTSAPKLKIIGDGPLRQEVHKKIDSLNIDFMGALSKNETLGFIKQAYTLILPSICYEGFPLVFREAIALSIPILTSNIGPQAQIIEQSKTGLTFKNANSKDLAEYVLKIYNDQLLRNQLSRNCVSQYKNKFNENVNFETLEKIYHHESHDKH